MEALKKVMTPKKRLEIATAIVELLAPVPDTEITPLLGMVIWIMGTGKPKSSTVVTPFNKKAH